MQIDLGSPDRKQGQGRRKAPSRRKARVTYDAAVAEPQVRFGQSDLGRRRRIGLGSARALVAAVLLPVRTLAAVALGLDWPVVLGRLPALLILAVLLSAMLYTSFGDEFYVSGADISGARHLDRNAIYEASGVGRQHILWVRPQQVKENISLLGGIKAVHVRCGLPATVHIEVEEREPTVMWRATSQERDWWLDEEGVVLPYHGDAHAEDVVFVVDSSDRPLRVGQTVEPSNVAKTVRRLASALPAVSLFYYDAGHGLSFTHEGSQSDWPVYIGTGDDLNRKLKVVEALTSHLEEKNIRPSYVDIRWADRPVYGKRSDSSKGKND